MSKSNVASSEWTSRRTILLKGASIAAGGLILTAPNARNALAQAKLPHEQAKYQVTPKDDKKCSTCVQFQPPTSCKIVADPISPNGWCQFYGAKSG